MNERNAGEIMETIPPKLKLPLKLYLEGKYGTLLDLLKIQTFSTHC